MMAGGAWLVLQVLALWQLRGGWRKAAWLCAMAMGLAVAVGVLGGLAGSNMAPIWIFLALPVCLAWIGALWIIRGVAWVISR